jgi:hypothetical protein
MIILIIQVIYEESKTIEIILYLFNFSYKYFQSSIVKSELKIE